MPDLVFSLLGPPRIERDGAPVGVDTRKAIALLAYLAVTGQPQRRDALAALLWPEYDQPHARATLRRTLSALAKALEGDQLDSARETIGLRAGAALRLDVDEFHRLLAECQTHGHAVDETCPACVGPLAAAAALYRDDFMAGFSLRDSPAWDDWQFFQRETLRRELAGVLRRLTGAYIGLGRYDDAITSARRWLALDPLHEPAHRSLMRLYAWSGQRAAAMRQYQTCVRALDRELGVAPLEATARLYEAIKADRLAPPPAAHQVPAASKLSQRVPARPTSSPASGVAQSAGEGIAVQAEYAPALPSASPTPASSTQLVGRSEEWKALRSAYDAIHDAGHVVVLAGEAGIGKTRLAEEFTADARANGGATVIATRCYDGEASLAYAPLIAALRAALAQDEIARRLAELPDRWLVEAARLAPEIARVRPGLPPPPQLDSPGAQGQFFEGLRKVLLEACRGPKPGILFFDDVQWADSASLDVLIYLARRLRDAPICLLLTWRPSEAPGRSHIRQLLAEGQRAGSATLVTLSRLSADDVRELLYARLPDAKTPTDVAQRLYEETEGVPFFVVEYLSALAQEDTPAERESWSLPGGIRELLHSRLRTVEGTSAQVLAAAAVIGRWFDFETLRVVSGRGEEETISALEELLARGLVRELAASAGPAPAYDFSHEKLRSQVYDEISLARRRLLHRRVAEALIAAVRRQRDGNGLLGQIAHHYLMAGDQAAAADYYQQAGERAKRLYANAEALAHLRTALALGHPDVAGLHEAIGDLHTSLGEYAAALQSYEAAEAEAEVETDGNPAIAARLKHKLGGVHARRGDWPCARDCFESAIERLGLSGEPGQRARIYADWSLVAHHMGQPEQAWDLASQARELAASTDDRHAQAQAHNILGVLAESRGTVEEAVGHLEQSLALAESAGDPSVRAAALNNLALALAARGDTERALAHAEAALALSAAQGDRHHEAALHNNIADLLHASGQPEAAMAHLKEAVRIYAEIGVEAGTVQPAIWKLAEW
ncbi:MAG TPA: AAA family ATPase [Ktedonobacterales bacterium]